jgi:hypothetical protein
MEGNADMDADVGIDRHSCIVGGQKVYKNIELFLCHMEETD